MLTLLATHQEPTSCPDGGGPTWSHTTGNWRRIDFVALPLHWLWACSNAHTRQHGELALQDAASVDVSLQLPCTGQRVNRNFASRRELKLPDVAQRSEALWRSVPGPSQHWHIDRTEASFTKLARIIFATVAPPEKRCPKADWITSETWAAIELHRDCRYHFLERIRQRKSLLLRLAFWAWSPSTFDQARKARADLAGNRMEYALQARFLQSVAKQASKAAQACRRSWLRRGSRCPLPFGLLSDISPRKRREGVRNQLLFSGLHRVTLQVRLGIWPACGKTLSSVRSIDGEKPFQHVPMFLLPLRCLTPPLRLLSLMHLWMPFRKLRLEKALAPTSFLLSSSRQAAGRFVCFLPDCFPKLVITELR